MVVARVRVARAALVARAVLVVQEHEADGHRADGEADEDAELHADRQRLVEERVRGLRRHFKNNLIPPQFPESSSFSESLSNSASHSLSASQSLSNSASHSESFSKSESLEFPNVQVTTNIVFETPVDQEEFPKRRGARSE